MGVGYETPQDAAINVAGTGVTEEGSRAKRDKATPTMKSTVRMRPENSLVLILRLMRGA